MKKWIWMVRGLAAGIVLALAIFPEKGVQAETCDNLKKITEVSADVFEELKPDGDVSPSKKREIVGNILFQAGVPEFAIEKLKNEVIEKLYASPGFEVQTEYFQEKPEGNLQSIPYEQHLRIYEYNETLRNKKSMPLSQTVLLGADDGVIVSDPVYEIPNLAHIVIVGGKFPDGKRLLVTMGAWQKSPTMRMKKILLEFVPMEQRQMTGPLKRLWNIQ